MNRVDRLTLHLSNLLVAGTGLVYAVMRYGMKPVDEWAVVNHPWQPHLLHLHVLSAPLLVFACGLIWHRHVLNKLRRGEQVGRRSGPGLLVALVPMVVAGYLIQITVDTGWRQAWVVLHLVASTAWIVVFAAHLVRPFRSWRQRRAVRGGTVLGSPPVDHVDLDSAPGTRECRPGGVSGGPLGQANSVSR